MVFYGLLVTINIFLSILKDCSKSYKSIDFPDRFSKMTNKAEFTVRSIGFSVLNFKYDDIECNKMFNELIKNTIVI